MTAKTNRKGFLSLTSPADDRKGLSPLFLRDHLVSLSNCTFSQHVTLSRLSTSLAGSVRSTGVVSPPLPHSLPYRGRRFSSSLSTGGKIGRGDLPRGFPSHFVNGEGVTSTSTASSSLLKGGSSIEDTSLASVMASTRARLQSTVGPVSSIENDSETSHGGATPVFLPSSSVSAISHAAFPTSPFSSDVKTCRQVFQQHEERSSMDARAYKSSSGMPCSQGAVLPGSASLPPYGTANCGLLLREGSAVRAASRPSTIENRPPLSSSIPWSSSSDRERNPDGSSQSLIRASEPLPPGLCDNTQSCNAKWSDMTRTDGFLSSMERNQGGENTYHHRLESSLRCSLTADTSDPRETLPSGVSATSSSSSPLTQEAPGGAASISSDHPSREGDAYSSVTGSSSSLLLENTGNAVGERESMCGITRRPLSISDGTILAASNGTEWTRGERDQQQQYYQQHLVMNESGQPSTALSPLTATHDPRDHGGGLLMGSSGSSQLVTEESGGDPHYDQGRREMTRDEVTLPEVHVPRDRTLTEPPLFIGRDDPVCSLEKSPRTGWVSHCHMNGSDSRTGVHCKEMQSSIDTFSSSDAHHPPLNGTPANTPCVVPSSSTIQHYHADSSCSFPSAKRRDASGGETIHKESVLYHHESAAPHSREGRSEQQPHMQPESVSPSSVPFSGVSSFDSPSPSFPLCPPITSSPSLGPRRYSRNCAEDRLGRWWYLRAFFPPPLSWRRPQEGGVDWGSWKSNCVYSGFKEEEKPVGSSHNVRGVLAPSSFSSPLPPAPGARSMYNYCPSSPYIQSSPSGAKGATAAQRCSSVTSQQLHHLTGSSANGVRDAEGSLYHRLPHGEGGEEGGEQWQEEKAGGISGFSGGLNPLDATAPSWPQGRQPHPPDIEALLRSRPKDVGDQPGMPPDFVGGERGPSRLGVAVRRDTSGSIGGGKDSYGVITPALPCDQVATATSRDGETRRHSATRRWLPDITLTPTGDLRVSSLSPLPGISCEGRKEEMSSQQQEAAAPLNEGEEKEEQEMILRGHERDHSLSFYPIGIDQHPRCPPPVAPSTRRNDIGENGSMLASMNAFRGENTGDRGCSPFLPFFLEDAFFPRPWSVGEGGQAGGGPSVREATIPPRDGDDEGKMPFFSSRTFNEEEDDDDDDDDTVSLFSSAFALGGDAEQLGGGIVVVPPLPLRELQGGEGDEEEQSQSDQGLFFSHIYSPGDSYQGQGETGCFLSMAADAAPVEREGGVILTENSDNPFHRTTFTTTTALGGAQSSSRESMMIRSNDYEMGLPSSMQQTLWEQQLSSVLSSQLAYQRELYELRLRNTENAFIAEIELATATTESLNEQSVILQVQLADLACRRRDVLKRIRSAQHRIKQIREDNRFLRDLVSSMRLDSKASSSSKSSSSPHSSCSVPTSACSSKPSSSSPVTSSASSSTTCPLLSASSPIVDTSLPSTCSTSQRLSSEPLLQQVSPSQSSPPHHSSVPSASSPPLVSELRDKPGTNDKVEETLRERQENDGGDHSIRSDKGGETKRVVCERHAAGEDSEALGQQSTAAAEASDAVGSLPPLSTKARRKGPSCGGVSEGKATGGGAAGNQKKKGRKDEGENNAKVKAHPGGGATTGAGKEKSSSRLAGAQKSVKGKRKSGGDEARLAELDATVESLREQLERLYQRLSETG
ncbi:zn-finger in ubiquitin-hydrolases domain-containing protein [Cystoisospora suis]|uniref:Zn-finger in ubiquitin-hydrolases domain-containing protein n=1 Tax=Cystoisospora suis TaxID=483139 RepID=A0A2C6KHA1_9APIC|nr:zn-finger in ubiquitin-hydrolases domain-containing protein [Cystoisospora suis]